MRGFLFVLAMLVLFGSVALINLLYSLRERRASASSWQDLLDRLVQTNHANLKLVALDLIQEDGRVRDSDWPELDSEQIWNLVDGMEGLEKIEANCQIFIDIAVYVQATYPEAVVVAEELRRNTRHIQWHVNRLRAGAQTGNLASSFASYAQRAVASYYLMGKQLVALCEEANFAGVEQLRSAV